MCRLNRLSLVTGFVILLCGGLLVNSREGQIPSLYVQAGNHSAKLSWSPPSGDPPLSYNIYRKLGGEPLFEKIDSTITDTFYVDHGLINDTLYSYFVTALTSDSVESDSSQVVDVLPNNWIIFVEGGDIWRMDAVDANGDSVGDNRVRLTSNPAMDITPDLSLDGTRIAFSSNRDGNFELYSMRSLDGGNLVRLTFNTYTDVSPSWSYDGSKIAYSSDRFCNYDIFIMQIAGGTTTPLTTNPGYDGNPAFSPSADQVSFDTQTDSTYQVYTIEVDSSSEAQSVSDSLEGDTGCPRWSPDGKSMVLCSRAQEAEWKGRAKPTAGYHIYLMEASGLHGINLTITTPFADRFNVYPHLLPQDFINDTISVYFSSDWDGDNEIYLLRGVNTGWQPQVFKLTSDTIENSPSGGVLAIQPEVIPPACPDSLQGGVEEKGIGVTLRWAPNEEGDFAYYSIYRDTASQWLPNLSRRLDTVTTTSFVDTTVSVGHTYYYIVTATDTLGSESGYACQVEVEVGVGIEGGSSSADLPTKPFLSQNYPNPFNPVTIISYGLPTPGQVNISIYNLLGERVVTLIEGGQAEGYHQISWNGKDSSGQDVASGVYLCRLETRGYSRTKKLLLLR